MKTFKEQMDEDIDIFLNLTEFAEKRRVEDKLIDVIVDMDQMNGLKNGQLVDLVRADMVLYGRSSDFPCGLSRGSFLNVDGMEMIVETISIDTGMTQIALRQQRTG